MNQIWVRKIRPEDQKTFVQWLYESRARNRFDPRVFQRADVEIFVAYDYTGPLFFMPVRACFLLESLAPQPGLSPVTEARCLQAIQTVLIQKAHEGKVMDMFFATFDETVQKFASAEHHGWKPVVVPFYNLNLFDLEKKPDEPTPDAAQ